MSTAGLNVVPLDRAMSLLVGQYSDSPNLKAYIAALMGEFDELHANSIIAILGRSLEDSTGSVLETLGMLVGQPRGTKHVLTGVFFGFESVIGAGSFGSTGSPSAGEVFRSVANTNTFEVVDWSDVEYRKFIKVKIVKNTKAITVNTLIEVISLVLDGISDIQITYISPLVYTIHIPEAISDNDKLLLLTSKLLPVPVGCSYALTDVNGPIFTN